MQKRHPLKAEKRDILGKKIKSLRRKGILPANVYGKGLDSLAIQVDQKEFENIFKEAGETGLIDLTVDKETRPVLIKNLQLKYPIRTPLHVDFFQVNLKEKVKTMVPIEIIGEAKAVTDKIGILLQPMNEIEVEALPADLPEKVSIDVSGLSALDEQIIVSDLKVSPSVTILTDNEQTVVKIAELTAPEPAAEEPSEPAAESSETEQTAETEKTEETAAEENK